MGRRTLLLLIAVFVLLPAARAHATVEVKGHLPTRDGTKLAYDLQRPDGNGPFPVLINYEGYAAGSDAQDNGAGTYVPRLLARGYAVLGVSVRGTGCSEGVFDPFALTMGQDGYDAVEWAARQPWSDGRVGMFGVSFGGITQLLTAADRPPHLKAIAPDSSTSDLYRDVVYPGGILEYDFTFAWTGVQKEGGTEHALTSGDPTCLQNYGMHEAGNATPDNFIPTLVLQNPFYDDSNHKWQVRAPVAGFPKINVPTYLFNQWQDEQLPAHIYDALNRFGRPSLVWANFSNGNHGRALSSASDQQLTLDFLDRFVRGVNNGFDKRVPHLSIDMETKLADNEPSWSIKRPTLDAGAKPRFLYLRSGGRMTPQKPGKDEGSDSYQYPLPSSDVAEPGPTEGGMSMGQFAWKAPVPPGGAVAYTTAPLTKDTVLAGPASLDVWLESTATDTDLQATVTEVRPDGEETYVQRGWLRASHRKLDPRKSSTLLPYNTNLRADSQPLVAGQPTYVRLEVFPFAHAFRKGSRMRIWIEAPTGHTGFWAFQPGGGPSTNTILHDAAHPSRLAIGVLPGEVAHAPLPACDTLRNQPCRPDPLSSG